MSEKKAFFSTLPGILTGIATLITAVVGLIYALNQIGILGPDEKEEVKSDILKHEEDKTNSGIITTEKTGNEIEGETTDGWFIIGYYERGTFSDLVLNVNADAPAEGKVYEALEDFRLTQKPPERGQATITLGMVHKGDKVKVLEIQVEPGTARVPVYAKLRAVLHSGKE